MKRDEDPEWGLSMLLRVASNSEKGKEGKEKVKGLRGHKKGSRRRRGKAEGSRLLRQSSLGTVVFSFGERKKRKKRKKNEPCCRHFFFHVLPRIPDTCSVSVQPRTEEQDS